VCELRCRCRLSLFSFLSAWQGPSDTPCWPQHPASSLACSPMEALGGGPTGEGVSMGGAEIPLVGDLLLESRWHLAMTRGGEHFSTNPLLPAARSSPPVPRRTQQACGSGWSNTPKRAVGVQVARASGARRTDLIARGSPPALHERCELLLQCQRAASTVQRPEGVGFGCERGTAGCYKADAVPYLTPPPLPPYPHSLWFYLLFAYRKKANKASGSLVPRGRQKLRKRISTFFNSQWHVLSFWACANPYYSKWSNKM
jgi:hypothetical protein